MATPKLRFKEFDREWSSKKVSSFLKKTSNPVNVELNKSYQQIGIRSHGKGIFHKDFVDGKALGNKRVFWVESEAFILNIVFAWERAIAVTTTAENGMIASHRFPMYLPKNNLSNVHFIRYMFLTRRGQSYLELASPGGAGRNKTLGQTAFANLTIPLPLKEEQTKIASFLSAVDDRIDQIIQKHKLLTDYKKGMMQQLFSQKLRFKADDGSEFEDWEERILGNVCTTFSGGTPTSSNPAFYEGSIPFIKSGEIAQESTAQFINKSALDNSSAKLVEKGDLLYALYGATSGQVAISQISGAINQAVLCIRSETLDTNYLHHYLVFRKEKIISTYLQGGQGNLSASILKKISIPTPSFKEQTKIANFLTAIDQKIDNVAEQIDHAKTWKKGLLQQMFL